MTLPNSPSPIRFRLLGGVALIAPDERAQPVLRQPKRLGLLAYLRLEGKDRPLRRDRIIAMFWPESAPSRGRASLRQGLRFLRTHLGKETLPPRGKQEVGVDPYRLWCDADAFAELSSRKRCGEALDLYRGALLPGFHVDGCAAFQEWLEHRRRRLAKLAARCAWQLAEALEAEGDLSGAASAGKRALELSPFDEIHVRSLMELLIRVGDHAGALRAYHGLERAVREEFGAQLSPATRALAERINPSEQRLAEDLGGRRRGGDRRIRSRREARESPPGGKDRRSGRDRRKGDRRKRRDRRNPPGE